MILKTKDGKLAGAQKVQAELVRKRWELDDAKGEVGLTVETRVLQSLAGVRDRAKREAEQELNLKKLRRKSRRLPACSARSRRSNAKPSRALSNSRK